MANMSDVVGSGSAGRPEGAAVRGASSSFASSDLSKQLEGNLAALKRNACYRVDKVLKSGEVELTERVFFVGENGAELGPFVRKSFPLACGIGVVYARMMQVYAAGERFGHLPRICDCYEVGDRQVVVMEHLAGDSLDKVLEARGPSLELAREVFPGCCDAVSELHTRFTPAVIHRDIKPSNFMLSGGNVMLIDLGIARSYSQSSSCDTTRYGSRGFAPPEQFGYGQTDMRSDVFSLGMLLFTLLTGKVAESNDLDEPLRRAYVHKALRDVIARAGAFDPTARYGSVAELREAFDAAMLVALGKAPLPQAVEDAQLKSNAPNSLRIVGAVWDVLLGLVLALLLAISVAAGVEKCGELPDKPGLLIMLSFMSVWVMFASSAIFLCDPRPFEQIMPRFAKMKFRYRLLLGIGVMIAAVVVVGVTGQFIRQ